MTTIDTSSRDGRFDVLAAACPTRQVINRIGDRWSLLVLSALGNGTLRFQELRRAVGGVSQKMLTQTLRALERDGLVQRDVYASVPPRVDYSLTPLGQSLSDSITAIRNWAYAHMDRIEAARAEFDAQGGDAYGRDRIRRDEAPPTRGSSVRRAVVDAKRRNGHRDHGEEDERR
jgi:DNA-binding HxlR family transcriptional regulator